MVLLSSHRISRVLCYSVQPVYAIFVYGAITLFCSSSQMIRLILYIFVVGSGCIPFARRYLGYRVFFLFLRLLRCFSSPGIPSHTLFYSCMDTLKSVGFPIRRSTVYRLFASTRSLSQLTASFIGSWCQGIHLMLFVI